MLERIRLRALAALNGLAFSWPLLSRVTLGVLFASTGWGKVHSLEKVTAFFVELKIPMPALNAFVVAYSELICGSLLLVGLFSRLATVPLLVSMIVALLTAKLDEIHGLPDLFGQVEFTYLVMLFAVLVAGPGSVSLDALLAKRLGKSALTVRPATLAST
jgi:putative oxidoreductase